MAQWNPQESLNDFVARSQASYERLPFSWRANFLQQPPQPWYNGANAGTPPGTGTPPAAAPAAGANPAVPAANGNSLNAMMGMRPDLYNHLSGMPVFGGVFQQGMNAAQNKWQNTPMLQGVGGLLNRILGMAGKSWPGPGQGTA